MNSKYIFSCVIMSTENVNDLNESFNIKNPYGIETFELVFNRIYLALLACTAMPIFFIILDIKTEDEEQYTKIILHREDIEKMTKEEIRDYLKNQCLNHFY